MRMQKEEKIVVILLLMALGSLAVAQWTFGDRDQNVATGKESPSVSIEGLVLDVKPTRTGGNLLIGLDSTPMLVFVPRDCGAEEIQRRIHPGDRIRIRGVLSEFQGEREIKIDRAADVVIIGS